MVSLVIETVTACILCSCIIYAMLKYLLPNKRKLILYLLMLSITLPLTAVNLFYILHTPGTGLQAFERFFHFRLLLTYGIPTVLFSILYGIRLYFRDTPNGVYLNPIIFYVFIIAIIKALENVALYFDYKMFSINHYILILNMLILIYIFIRKLNYCYSLFGDFYEDIIYNRKRFNDVVIKRRGISNMMFYLQVTSFIIDRKYLATTPIFICLIFFEVFEVSMMNRINLLVLITIVIFMLLYIHLLYCKRLRNNGLLHIRQNPI
ncbi:hypothetical protein JXJ21_12720 [candidate division KSB1 bacterium]|nr:hypothetical protein [candidate division KSB1 bacterium]